MDNCPFCHSKRVASLGGHLFRCASCGSHFDDDPNEGGDFSNRHPDARLIRQEVAEERREQDRQRRVAMMFKRRV